MEQTVLTSHQYTVLELAKKDPSITNWYYLTGGTALTEFYLKHRLSEDIDLFTRSNVNDRDIDRFFENAIPLLGCTGITKRRISGLFMYTLTFTDGTILKIDFSEYNFPQVEQGKKIGNLWIDSRYDIAVNKLYTIMSRSKARDFVDLYFCMKAEDCSFEQLFARVIDKFGMSFEDLTVVTQFNHVLDVTDYPTMLVPFDKEKMIDFFLSEAKKLEPRIFQ